MEKDTRSVEERRAQILREAELHRQGIVLARLHIKNGMRPDVIMHNAIDSATYAVRSRVDSVLTPAGLSVTALMPYAIRVFGVLRRRRKLKPALGVAAVLGGAAWYLNYRREKKLMGLT